MFSLQSQIGAPRAPKEFNVTFWWLVVITVVAGVFWIEGRDIANDLGIGRDAVAAPPRLRRGRRGERIGTFPRRFRGRDRVGWPWFEVEAGSDDRAQSIATRQLLVA